MYRHTICFSGGNHKERQEQRGAGRKRRTRLADATLCFTQYLALLCTNAFEGGKIWEMKKHRAEEVCRERLGMLSLPPPDSFTPREAAGLWLHCSRLQQPTDIRLWWSDSTSSPVAGWGFQSFPSQISGPGSDKIKEPQCSPPS